MKTFLRDIYLFLAIFCIYTLGRVAILLIFPDPNTEITLSWLLLALRFDMLTAAYFLIPSALCSILSFWCKSDFSIIKKWYAIVAMCVSFFIATINVCFFYEYKSQFNHWIFGVFVDDYSAIVETIIQDYPVILISVCVCVAFVVVVFLTNYVYRKTETLSYVSLKSTIKIFLTVLYVFVMFVMLRGGKLSGRPLQLRDIAITPSSYLNNLVPTSAYCLKVEISKYLRFSGKSGLKSLGVKERDIPYFVKELFKTNSTSIDDVLTYTKKGEPLLKNKPKRIFVIIGESNSAWPLVYSLPDYDVCPQQKDLIKGAFHCKKALPAGLGTMITVSSIISGIPATDLFVKGVYRQANDYSFAGHMKRLGYKATFFYAGQSTWLQLDEFARFNNFDNVVGGEKMGNLYGLVEWGLRDKDMFDYIASLDIPENSFNMVLTVSNHQPYDVDLVKEGCPVEPKTDMDNKIWHHWYSDKAIVEFVRKILKKYPDSIFVITGDHPSRMLPKQLDSDILANNTVPIIFIGGKKCSLNAREIDYIIHLDIMPTLVDLIAPDGFEYKTWGSSAFNPIRRLPPMNTNVVIYNGRIIAVNSNNCPDEYKQAHKMYMALAYFRSVSGRKNKIEK